MAFLQPATANYFGLMPVIGQAEGHQTNAYAVSSSEGQIALGDLVVMTSRNTVKAISTGSAAGGTNVMGVSAQYFPANAGSTKPAVNIEAKRVLLILESPVGFVCQKKEDRGHRKGTRQQLQLKARMLCVGISVELIVRS